MIHALDRNVGRIMQSLEQTGQADRTILFFMSDNGSMLSNAPLRSGKKFPYEGGLRVPFLVKWPGVVKAGTTCSIPVSAVDHYPTILDMVGIEGDRSHDRCVDGVSLVPLLRGADTIKRQAVFWHYPHYDGARPYGAVRAGDWKLIEHYEDSRVELYHLAKDLGEKNDLSAAMPARAAELTKMLHQWRKRVGAQMPHWPVQSTEKSDAHRP
jgi:arylsulfatase A-like enzyme